MPPIVGVGGWPPREVSITVGMLRIESRLLSRIVGPPLDYYSALAAPILLPNSYFLGGRLVAGAHRGGWED